MSQQISDLVINLDVDNASFTEQIARIKGQLKGMSDTSDLSSQRMARFAERQASAMKELESAGAQAALSIREKNSAATSAMQSEWQKTSQSVQDTHSRLAALSQQLSENQAKSQSTAKLQDETTASFFREIDAIKGLSGETRALTSVQAQLRQARTQGRISQQDYLALLTRSTERQRELRLEEEKSAAARTRFLQGLKSQVATQNLSREELLRYQATQLGVGNAAEIYISKLEKSKKTTHGLGLESKAARQELGILFSELARGNFGSLKGSSITLANRAGWIDQLFSLRGLGIATTVGGITAAIYALGKSFYDADVGLEKLHQSLALTSDFSGMTVTSMLKVIDATRLSGLTYSAASESLNALARAGVPAGANFERLTVTAAKFSKETGLGLDEIAKGFAEIANDPTKGILALNEKYHFLSAAQFKRIQQLQEEGKYTDALAEANRVAADGMDDVSRRMKESLGTISGIMRGISDIAKEMWDSVEGIGRPDSLSIQITAQEKYVAQLKAKGNAAEIYTPYGGMAGIFTSSTPNANELASAEAMLENLRKQRKEQQEKDDAVSRAQSIHNQNLKDSIALQDGLNQGLTSREKREKAINDLNQQRLRMNKAAAEDPKRNVGMSDAEYSKRLANINNQYKDPKTPKGKAYSTPAGIQAEDTAQADLLALQAQLQTLKEHKSVNDVISQQRKDLWGYQAKINILQQAQDGPLQRQLSAKEKSLLASSQQTLALKEQLALLGDQITAQEQLNRRNDVAQKYVNQMAEKQAALKASSILSDRESGRESVFAQLRSGWQNSGGSLDDAGYKKQLDAARNYFAEEDRLRGDWKAGAQKSWADYSDAATNVYEQMKNAGTSAFNGISSQLTSVLTTGKSNFKDFTKSILSMLTEILVKMQLVNGVNSLSKAFGWNFQANANGGVYNSASLSAYSGSIVDKPTFFAFANGGGVMGEAGPEAILPLRRGANGKLGVVAGNSGVGNPVFHNTIILQNDGTATSKTSGGNDAMSKAMMKMLDKFCQDSIVKALRPGGLIFNATRSR